MANEAAAAKPKRERKPRPTAAQARAKSIEDIEVNLTQAGKRVVFAAEGLVASGERERAKRCLDVWQMLIDIAMPPTPAEAPTGPAGAQPAAAAS